jgi:hypothetical protein
MFDLHKPVAHYGRTPFWAAAAICGLAFTCALWLRDPRNARVTAPSALETDA